eukprot:GHVP01048614.1.p1 GENE.GHVP01048614.1~~GHVP01048614.1.p1  ORF type:complete len:548 (-),score=130.63 GHVP01048614.1:1686-3329(-)
MNLKELILGDYSDIEAMESKLSNIMFIIKECKDSREKAFLEGIMEDLLRKILIHQKSRNLDHDLPDLENGLHDVKNMIEDAKKIEEVENVYNSLFSTQKYKENPAPKPTANSRNLKMYKSISKNDELDNNEEPRDYKEERKARIAEMKDLRKASLKRYKEEKNDREEEREEERINAENEDKEENDRLSKSTNSFRHPNPYKTPEKKDKEFTTNFKTAAEMSGIPKNRLKKDTNKGPMNKDANRNKEDEEFPGIEPRLIELIRNEIIVPKTDTSWDDIAGVEHAKKTIQEAVIWPMLRPDLFNGIRGPPKGILLFGPPGTGKTMLGRCIACQANASFFSISSSSLTSKWVGEGEKMVKALFAVAKKLQPSVVFVDEIDSLLTQRTDGEFEATRRIKTEFLVQLDGAGTDRDDRILIVGATNRPHEIDEAARRRLIKRLYIPLPDLIARGKIIRKLIEKIKHSLNDDDMHKICESTDGYSGSDMDALCREAALGPIRSIEDIMSITCDTVRPVSFRDFEEALKQVRASVSEKDLDFYVEWNKSFGSLNV